ncbi:hypothetical protein [Enhydrobacter sp.]|jgi:hypothetical protein|uniref:hypothetical protein n=1 Tax=Enhydrobacter sp. TaxID=1894999 RepID=UPI0026031106|nr:hypothetical protein [Enhydrobacter sp.]WIM12958.1 MAG: hypothetical protein OJF58_003922 [Enhydrobacter sp.]
MGHKGSGQSEHTGVAGERAVAQLRQLAIVTLRQVSADFSNLLLDQVKIVEQPFGSRRHGSTLNGSGGNRAISTEQHAFVVAETGDERPAGGFAQVNRLAGCKALRMLLQSLNTEQLAADGTFIIADRVQSVAPEVARYEGSERAWHIGRQRTAGPSLTTSPVCARLAALRLASIIMLVPFPGRARSPERGLTTKARHSPLRAALPNMGSAHGRMKARRALFLEIIVGQSWRNFSIRQADR